jgi:hypothetical protein
MNNNREKAMLALALSKPAAKRAARLDAECEGEWAEINAVEAKERRRSSINARDSDSPFHDRTQFVPTGNLLHLLQLFSFKGVKHPQSDLRQVSQRTRYPGVFQAGFPW